MIDNPARGAGDPVEVYDDCEADLTDASITFSGYIDPATGVVSITSLDPPPDAPPEQCGGCDDVVAYAEGYSDGYDDATELQGPPDEPDTPSTLSKIVGYGVGVCMLALILGNVILCGAAAAYLLGFAR